MRRRSLYSRVSRFFPKWLSLVVPLVVCSQLSGCGSDSDFAEGLGFSAEVEDVSVSDDVVGAGETVDVEVTVETGEIFDAQDAFVLIRFSPQLRYIEGSASFEINASFDSDQFPPSGTPQFGSLHPICSGQSQEFGDGYVGFRLDGDDFSDAYNTTAKLLLSFRAVAPSHQVFVIADARDSLDSSECRDFSVEPEAADDLTIVGRSFR